MPTGRRAPDTDAVWINTKLLGIGPYIANGSFTIRNGRRKDCLSTESVANTCACVALAQQWRQSRTGTILAPTAPSTAVNPNNHWQWFTDFFGQEQIPHQLPISARGIDYIPLQLNPRWQPSWFLVARIITAISGPKCIIFFARNATIFIGVDTFKEPFAQLLGKLF